MYVFVLLGELLTCARPLGISIHKVDQDGVFGNNQYFHVSFHWFVVILKFELLNELK